MKDYLTIGQAAKLLDISTHQIRYYEERNLIKPIMNEDNGYRMYGEDEIYTLAHALFLRKFNIPIAKIHEAFSSFTQDDYIDLMQTNVVELEKEINRLVRLKNDTISLINAITAHIEKLNTFTIKDLGARKVNVLANLSHTNANFGIRDFYDIAIKQTDILEQDFITLIDKKRMLMCVEDLTMTENTIEIPSGKYLCYPFLSKDESDFDIELCKFENYAKKNKLKLKGELIMVDNSMVSITYNKHFCFEYQCLAAESTRNI